MSTNNEWKRIVFGSDLASLAIKHVDFLAWIDSERSIYSSEEQLKKAIYRYEKYWLPLCAQLDDEDFHLKYYPPIDVAWVKLL